MIEFKIDIIRVLLGLIFSCQFVFAAATIYFAWMRDTAFIMGIVGVFMSWLTWTTLKED